LHHSVHSGATLYSRYTLTFRRTETQADRYVSVMIDGSSGNYDCGLSDTQSKMLYQCAVQPASATWSQRWWSSRVISRCSSGCGSVRVD